MCVCAEEGAGARTCDALAAVKELLMRQARAKINQHNRRIRIKGLCVMRVVKHDVLRFDIGVNKARLRQRHGTQHAACEGGLARAVNIVNGRVAA